MLLKNINKNKKNKECQCKKKKYIFYFSEPASHYKQDGECLYGLCKCDADAAKCFAKYEDKYNEKFKFYPKIFC